MPRLTVATAQFTLRPEHTEDDFLGHIDAVAAEAARRGAELLVLPELASTGLLASIRDHDVTSKTITSDYWNVLSALYTAIEAGVRQIAINRNLVLLGGSHIRLDPDGSLRNTAILAHPDGHVDTQDKLHLTPPEHELGMRGGDRLVVSAVGPFTLGILICADIQFPELSRYLQARGVDMILCPSLTWNRRGVHRVRVGCQARAMENQLYVVMSPLIGTDGLPTDAPMYATGAALVAAPVDRTVGANDGLLGLLDGAEEQLLVLELDPELLEASRARPETPGLGLRRPKLYAALRAEIGST
jgi:predicted amidohydrolase